MKRLLQIHLAVALFCLPFLSIYAFDGILCGHRNWVQKDSAFIGLIEGAHTLHATAGLHRDFDATGGWGIAVVVISLGLICLGVTGFWLWLPRLKERRAGIVFLAVSLGYAVTCLTLIFKG